MSINLLAGSPNLPNTFIVVFPVTSIWRMLVMLGWDDSGFGFPLFENGSTSAEMTLFWLMGCVGCLHIALRKRCRHRNAVCSEISQFSCVFHN